MTIHWTKERVLALLDECVADRGEDFVYRKPEWPEVPGWKLDQDDDPDTSDPGCVYVVQQGDALKPSCVVGQMLWREDPAILGYIVASDLNTSTGASDLLEHLEADDRLEFGEDVANLVNEVQRAQDLGVPYGAIKEIFHLPSPIGAARRARELAWEIQADGWPAHREHVLTGERSG